MSVPNNYNSFADFEREVIRPGYRLGFSMEDLVEDSPYEAEAGLDTELSLFRREDRE